MSHLTASLTPTEKISSPKSTNVHDVIISAITVKEFQDEKLKLLVVSMGLLPQ